MRPQQLVCLTEECYTKLGFLISVKDSDSELLSVISQKPTPPGLQEPQPTALGTSDERAETYLNSDFM